MRKYLLLASLVTALAQPALAQCPAPACPCPCPPQPQAKIYDVPATPQCVPVIPKCDPCATGAAAPVCDPCPQQRPLCCPEKQGFWQRFFSF
jgi:hypothetical protein